MSWCLDCGTEIALPIVLTSLKTAKDNWGSIQILYAVVGKAT